MGCKTSLIRIKSKFKKKIVDISILKLVVGLLEQMFDELEKINRFRNE